MNISAEFAAILLTIAFGFLSIASAIAFGLRNFSGVGPKLDNLSVNSTAWSRTRRRGTPR